MTLRTQSSSSVVRVNTVEQAPVFTGPKKATPAAAVDGFSRGANKTSGPAFAGGAFGLPPVGADEGAGLPDVGPAKTLPVTSPGAEVMDEGWSVGGGLRGTFGSGGVTATGGGVVVTGGGLEGGIGFRNDGGKNDGIGFAKGDPLNPKVTTTGDVQGGIEEAKKFLGLGKNDAPDNRVVPGKFKEGNGSDAPSGAGNGGGHGQEPIRGGGGTTDDVLGAYGFDTKGDGARNKGAAGPELEHDAAQPEQKKEKVDTNDKPQETEQKDESQDEVLAQNDDAPDKPGKDANPNPEGDGHGDPRAMPNPEGTGGSGPRSNVFTPDPDNGNGAGTNDRPKPDASRASGSSGGSSITTADGWGDGNSPAAPRENVLNVANIAALNVVASKARR